VPTFVHNYRIKGYKVNMIWKKKNEEMLGRKKASVIIASIIPHIIKLNSD